MIPAESIEMKLPHFPSRKNSEKPSKNDEEVFAEAKELAALRLEQCIADLRMSAAMKDALRSRGIQQRKYINLF